MERSKLPKSLLKPPSKLPMAPKSRPVKSPIKVEPLPPVRPLALRRRSKSVTDLRSVAHRPLNDYTNRMAAINKNKNAINERPSSALKVAQKRPAATTEEPVKAKMTKKIPDWDYKSRFLDLQTKHNALRENFKQTNTKLEGLNELQEELQTLKTKNEEQSDEIKTLNQETATLNEELRSADERYKNKIERLEQELKESKQVISTNKIEKETLEETISLLKTELNLLKEENRQTCNENRSLKTQNADLSEKLYTLKCRCKDLESTNEELRGRIDEHENLRRVLHNRIQDLKGNIRVFCRVRPPVSQEEFERQICAINYPTDTNIEIRKSRESISTISGKLVDVKQEFSFDKVFAPECTQEEIFEELAQLLQSALDGYHVCVFAYGQTGSGKTHTMQGCSNDLGMIPRAINFIFENIKKLEMTHWKYTVKASFLEIYNENIKDLLQPNSTHSYEIKYNEGRGVTVSNISIVPINTAQDLMNLMNEAHRNRAVAATDFNEHSSRSHAVTKIELEATNTNTKVTYSGSVNLIDLAGSESAKTSAKDRMAETKSINKSLSTLGMVIMALQNKEIHIPYRNSKLTFLLQSCLGGNSKTLMFVNIAPFEECYGESVNSLRFASKVKEIKTVAKKNKICDD